MSVRTAVVLLLGIAVAVLTVLSHRYLSEAILAGITALVGGIRFFHWLIDQ